MVELVYNLNELLKIIFKLLKYWNVTLHSKLNNQQQVAELKCKLDDSTINSSLFFWKGKYGKSQNSISQRSLESDDSIPQTLSNISRSKYSSVSSFLFIWVMLQTAKVNSSHVTQLMSKSNISNPVCLNACQKDSVLSPNPAHLCRNLTRIEHIFKSQFYLNVTAQPLNPFLQFFIFFFQFIFFSQHFSKCFLFPLKFLVQFIPFIRQGSFPDFTCFKVICKFCNLII